MVDMLEAPEFVDELLDALVEFDLGIVEEVAKYDVDGVLFGDDWGQQKGLLFGARLWRRFIKPRLAVLYGAVKRTGKAVLIHCCGKVQELFPELIDPGAGRIQPLPAGSHGPGGHEGTVRRPPGFLRRDEHPEGLAVRNAAAGPRRGPSPGRQGRPGRRFSSSAPSHDMPGDIPVENIVALAETMQVAVAQGIAGRGSSLRTEFDRLAADNWNA